MPIEFKCSSCGKRMKTDDTNAGKKGKCPKCGAKVDIPLPGLPQRQPPAEPSQPAIPSVPTSPAPAPEAQGPESKGPASKGPETDLFGAAAQSTVSWDANQDFLSELAGPAADASTPLAGPSSASPNLSDGNAGAYPPQTPAPTYAPPPSYASAPANPYTAYAPAYGAAPPRRNDVDTPGIFGLILGGMSLLVMLSGCVVTCSGLPALLLTIPVSLIMSVVGLILGFYATGNLRTAALAINGIALGGIAVVVIVALALLLLGLGIVAAHQ